MVNGLSHWHRVQLRRKDYRQFYCENTRWTNEGALLKNKLAGPYTEAGT